VGLTNRIPGDVGDGRVTVRGVTLPLADPTTAHGKVIALVRPEAVTLSAAPEGTGALVGTVIATTFLGATSRITVDLGDITVMAQLGTSEAAVLPAGSRVRLSIRDDPVLVVENPRGPDLADEQGSSPDA
jgi:putative spermidine/putrescine transport system ATP-binding protein